jgi:peptidyl-tRNA hydrolase
MNAKLKIVGFIVLSVSGLGMIYLNSIEEDFDDAPVMITPEFKPPVSVPVQQMIEQSKSEVYELSEEELTLRNFEYDLRKAQLEAAIAEAKNKIKKLRSEAKKDEAEIENLQREGKKLLIETESAKLIAEAELRARENAKVSSALPPAGVSEPIVTTTPTVQYKDESDDKQQAPSVSVNRINGDQVTITVDGRIGLVRVGSAFSGYLVQSVTNDGSSVLLKNITTGKYQSLNIASNNSRRFANPQPIGPKARGDQSPVNSEFYTGE